MTTATGHSAGAAVGTGSGTFLAVGVIRTLLLPIAKDSFSLAAGTEVYSAVEDGGKSLFSAGVNGTPALAMARFILSQAEYHYLMAFYRVAVLRGAEPFYLSIVDALSVPTTQLAWFVPKSLQIISTDVFTVSIAAQLLVLS